VSKSSRRGFIRAASGAAVAAPVLAVTATPAAAEPEAAGWCKPKKEIVYPNGEPPTEQPLFSPVVTFGDLVFISGLGAHFEGDITSHTEHVLNEVERYLEAAGSSMAKVLKVNVYLNSLDDYDGMNAVFLGRFGRKPGVRTTIAAAAGIPGDSLVEIDCIACR